MSEVGGSLRHYTHSKTGKISTPLSLGLSGPRHHELLVVGLTTLLWVSYPQTRLLTSCLRREAFTGPTRESFTGRRVESWTHSRGSVDLPCHTWVHGTVPGTRRQNSSVSTLDGVSDLYVRSSPTLNQTPGVVTRGTGRNTDCVSSSS